MDIPPDFVTRLGRWMAEAVERDALPLFIDAGDGGMPVRVATCSVDANVLALTVRRRILARHDQALLQSFKRCYPQDNDAAQLESILDTMLEEIVMRGSFFVLVGMVFGVANDQWIDSVLDRFVNLGRCPGQNHEDERSRLFVFGRRRAHCSEKCLRESKAKADKRRGSRRDDARRQREKTRAVVGRQFERLWRRLLNEPRLREQTVRFEFPQQLTAEDVRSNASLRDEVAEFAELTGIRDLTSLLSQLGRYRKPIPKTKRRIR